MMARPRNDSRLGVLLSWAHRGEDFALAFLLLLTLGLAFGQIVLRNVMGTSIIWADSLVRILVLWLGMIGAMLAARENRHIGIDLISRYLSPGRQLLVESAVSLFAGGVCLVAAHFSLLFVISEYRAGEIAFARVPAWLCEAILPTAFAIIAMRYLIQSVLALAGWRKAGPQ